MAENRPTKVLKLGGIEIAKWEKPTQDGKILTSYSFQKSYKDKNSDEWKHTGFFNLSDLSILSSLILITVGKNAKVTEPKAVAPTQAEATPEKDEDVPF